MRIVGGKFRGKKLTAPKSDAIRPTTDRVRESLFNILSHRLSFAEARILDCFAGTGALGLEAMSRGGKFCLFMDEGAEARALIRANVEAMSLQGNTKIFRRDATNPGPAGKMGQFDLVFLDPPYARGLGERAMKALMHGGWLNKGSIIVMEERQGHLPDGVCGCEELDRRSFGDTEISIYEAQGG